MLLTITNRHKPATDLSFLLHKHPAKIQSVELSNGKAHVFYERADDEECTAVLLLDIDPVGLVRNDGPKGNDFALEQYVNDRPYVASSFMSAAIAKAFSTALNGRCKDKPELVDRPFSLEVKLAVLPVKGGEDFLRKLFEPLGYTLNVTTHLLDPAFPDWGQSRYYTLILKNEITVQQLLSHLYVLIPVCDNDKHYWVTEHEVEKLLEKGKDWLDTHPEKKTIVRRYLKHQRSLANKALEVLVSKNEEDTELLDADFDAGLDAGPADEAEKVIRIHDQRLIAAKDVLLHAGCKRVVDLGCGEGRLMKLLLAERAFDYVLGMDISYRSLEIAKERLKLERFSEKQLSRVRLIQGSLTYRDKRIEGFDGATLVEVIEHLDQPRLTALERTVFEFAKPATVVITTPNAEYNIRFPDYKEGKMRHSDHRFEWTRKEFESWASAIASKYSYDVSFSPVGEVDVEVGALSQMAVFKLKTEKEEFLS
ncbi:3' terminal RNA ribose 2'-O-methyltransferase Hen1 [Desertivirga xinjiangensis]|uniref:3' terminal RNA ribose 2'-O-methyltransferase Hen1 n=1 Tax=Desertivirga xinjiangensis TaxID=539206 RepID=UPI002108CA07|nr:3' terminal RNA ribose 2'-O-methyltransferase Hen1 [Pedobacter xinjiangensis]